MRRIVVGSEKACKLHFHEGIVRANKMQVNDYMSGMGFLKFVNEGTN